MPSTINSAPFISAVKELCENKIWSQADLAKKSGLSRAQLSRLLSGKSKRVQQSTVNKITAAFGLNKTQFDALLGAQQNQEIQAAKTVVHIDRLPTVSGNFIGRETELKLLDHAFTDQNINIIQLIATGGAGKSKLLRHWLNQHIDNIENYIIWSFYSQGIAEDKLISATPFFNQALRALKADKIVFSSEEEKGDYLTDLLVQHQCLLVLDGLEPLQDAGRGASGRIKDRALARLLKNLANHHSNLCIITTRLKVHDISDRVHVMDYSLDNLTIHDGVHLLQSLGVTGTIDALGNAVTEYQGHALALHLLGNTLTTYLNGDIQKRNTLNELIDSYDEQGRHAFKIMQAYQHWLTDENGQPTAELQFLYLLGLFDHPVDITVLQTLWQAKIPGLTENIPQKAWHIALRDLRERHRLLSVHTERPDLLDCHPLIREYFGKQLQKNNPESWQQAHEYLYEHYKKLPEKELPDTLEEMQPLFLAVAHGCKAKLYQKTFDEVYWPRIQRSNKHYLMLQLGAFSDELAVISNFYLIPWSTPQTNFTEEYKNALFYSASMSLNALGRLNEALQPAEQTLHTVLKENNWKSAAQFANHIGRLKFTLGDLPGSIDIAQQAIKYADQSDDQFERMACRATCADAHHQTGDINKALALFKETEKIYKSGAITTSYFYSIWGYCELLIAQQDINGTLDKVEQTYKWLEEGKVPKDYSLLTIALESLNIGRLRLLRGELGSALKLINLSVFQLKQSGHKEIQPLGLLNRANIFRKTSSFTEAHQDLQEAYEIAEPSGMRLHLTDYHLEMARLLLTQWQQQLLDDTIQPEIQSHIAAAVKLIEETGYHRRDAEVEALVGPVQAGVNTQKEWSEEW